MGSKYSKKFFESFRHGALSSARAVTPGVLECLSPHAVNSVIDVGCGLGTWLAIFQENGAADILGVDGEYIDAGSLEIPRSCFLARDLSTPLNVGRTFDLAISLEVAEHIVADAADVFIQSLTELAPVVLFSAAIPGQGGKRHVNEQWPQYWAELFAKRHFVAVDSLRCILWGDARVDFWYQQNTIFFVDTNRLSEYPNLEREYERTGGRVASLVHPELFERWKEWGIKQSQAYWEEVQKNAAGSNLLH